MQRLKRLASRGARSRSIEIDETSSRWKERSGRSTGPLNYVPGDLCRSVFRQSTTATHKERDEIYGGPVMLIGLLEASNLPNTASKGLPPNAYCTIVPLGPDGKELESEKKLSRAITGSDVMWDEVHAVCTATDISTVTALRIKVKHFDSKWKSEKIGEADIFLDEGVQLLADANLGKYYSGWLELRSDDAPKASAEPAPAATSSTTASFLRRMGRSSTTVLSSKEATAAASPPVEWGRGGSDPASSSRSRTASAASSTDTPTSARARAVSAASNPPAPAGGDATSSCTVDTTGVARDRAVSTSSEESSASTSTATRVHVWVLLHRPPPDPTPTAVHLRVAEARSVLAADKTGFSDPYVRVQPKLRLNEVSLDLHGKPAELTTSVITQTLTPVWNESLLFYDVEYEEPSAARVASYIPAPRIPFTTSQELGIKMHNTRYLDLLLKDKDAVGRDDDLGEVVVSFSDLFGDEDAVLSEHTLAISKWYRIRPCKSMDRSLEGTLGHIRLDITLTFDVQLLPTGWQEAIDNDTNESYFFNLASGKAQWEEPPELVALRAQTAEEEGLALATGVAEGAGFSGVPSSGAGVSVGVASPTSAGGGGTRSTAERYRRGSMDALMFLAVHGEDNSKGLGDEVGLNVISEAGETSDGEESLRGDGHTKSPDVRPAPTGGVMQPPPLSQLKEDIEGAELVEDDEAGSEDDVDASRVAAATSAVDPFSRKKAAVPDSFSNPLSAAARAEASTPAERMKLMAEAMQRERDDKKKAEDAVLAAKLAAMSPEERAEFEAAQQRDARRDQRKNRMLQSQFSAYGSAKASALAKGKRSSSARK